MAEKSQSFQNHTRVDPAFHQFLVPLGLILLIAAIVNVIRFPGWSSAFLVLAAIWAVVAQIKMRMYALKIQDRLIRLEERIRLATVLPDALNSRIGELTEDQFIGLRFASDPELPALCEKTLAGKWSRKQIKQAIQTWRPDHWRV